MATSRAADRAPWIPDDRILGTVTFSRSLNSDHFRLNLLDFSEKLLFRTNALVD
jgi:hypothetical protein